MTATTNLYYAASIAKQGHSFPLRGEATPENLLLLANYGTTPARVTPELEAEATRIREALAAGRTVTRGAATISPISEQEYKRTR